MKIGIAADHGGFALKLFLAAYLKNEGHELIDFGAHILDKSDDYPDFIIPLAIALANKQIERGIALCGSGVGATIAANKIHGVRACLITDHFSAHQGVEDDAMNMMCIGGRITGNSVALELLQSFIKASFSNAERHLRRLNKVKSIEENNAYPNHHL